MGQQYLLSIKWATRDNQAGRAILSNPLVMGRVRRRPRRCPMLMAADGFEDRLAIDGCYVNNNWYIIRSCLNGVNQHLHKFSQMHFFLLQILIKYSRRFHPSVLEFNKLVRRIIIPTNRTIASYVVVFLLSRSVSVVPPSSKSPFQSQRSTFCFMNVLMECCGQL